MQAGTDTGQCCWPVPEGDKKRQWPWSHGGLQQVAVVRSKRSINQANPTYCLLHFFFAGVLLATLMTHNTGGDPMRQPTNLDLRGFGQLSTTPTRAPCIRLLYYSQAQQLGQDCFLYLPKEKKKLSMRPNKSTGPVNSPFLGPPQKWLKLCLVSYFFFQITQQNSTLTTRVHLPL